MSKLRLWALLGMVCLTGILSLGADCDFRLVADEDGISFDADDNDDSFFDQLEDLFD